MNKGCHRVKHGNEGWLAKKQEKNAHPVLDTTNDLPCSAHNPMCWKTSGCQVELFDQQGGVGGKMPYSMYSPFFMDFLGFWPIPSIVPHSPH